MINNLFGLSVLSVYLSFFLCHSGCIKGRGLAGKEGAREEPGRAETGTGRDLFWKESDMEGAWHGRAGSGAQLELVGKKSIRDQGRK